MRNNRERKRIQIRAEQNKTKQKKRTNASAVVVPLLSSSQMSKKLASVLTSMIDSPFTTAFQWPNLETRRRRGKSLRCHSHPLAFWEGRANSISLFAFLNIYSVAALNSTLLSGIYNMHARRRRRRRNEWKEFQFVLQLQLMKLYPAGSQHDTRRLSPSLVTQLAEM